MKIPKTFRPKKDGIKSRPRPRRLGRVLDQEYKKLDYQTETRKQELDYMARITEEYWDQLKDIVKPKKNIGTRDLEILLFQKTMNIIQKTESYCNTIGMTIYIGDPENVKEPEYQLGWVDIFEDDDDYIFYVTPTGQEIVDDLKTIRKQKFDKYPTKTQKRRKKKPKIRNS